MKGLADYTGPVLESCDVLIVGSGPGGGTLAWKLAQSGLSVTVVEAGSWVKTFEKDFGKTIASHFWDGGMRAVRGNVTFPTLQARALGGGSVFNSAICMRPTASALARWRADHGLADYTEEALAPHFDAVEAFFDIHPVADEVMGRRNELFRDACNTLGWSVEKVRRNERGCVGSAECILGCRNEAKLSLDRRGIKEFVEAGGRVLTHLQVDQLLIEKGVAKGIVGHVVDGRATPLHHARIHAKVVVVAAGAINTPAILRRSGLRDRSVGDNLRFHPSGYLVGIFDDRVYPWTGATQGYHSTQFLNQGIKLESLWATAPVFAQRFPLGVRQFKRLLKRYDRAAVWDTWVSAEDSVGRVGVIPGTNKLDIQYDVGRGDLRRLQEGNALLAELFAAAGAREVLTGIKGLPEVMDAAEAPRILREAKLLPSDLPCGSNHVMGGAVMGADPTKSVCDGWGAVHGTANLYLCDTSIFPTSPGVNPMLTAMALAHRLGEVLPGRV